MKLALIILALSNHVVRNRSSKIRVEWSASKRVGTSRNGNASPAGAILEAS
jgi:hypothetical protein